MEKVNIYKNLGRGMYLVALSRCINRFGDFVEITLVLILSVTLGLSPKVVGLLSTVVFILRFLGQLLSGVLSDYIERKKILPFLQLSVSFIYALSVIAIIKGESKALIFLILLSSPFRGGTQPITNALTADFVTEERISDAFSLLYLLTNLGIALGSIIAGLLFKNLVLLFYLSSFLIFLCALLVIFFIPKVSEKKKERREKKKFNKVQSVTFILFYFSFFMALYSFFYNGTIFMLPLESGVLFGEDKGPLVYSSVQSCNALTVIIFTTIISYLFRPFKTVNRMLFGMVFYFLGTVCFIFLKTAPLIIISMSVWTLGEILMSTNTSAFVNEIAPQESRGTYNAILLSFGSVGSACSPTLLGLLLEKINFSTAWALLSLYVIFLSSFLFILKTFLIKKKLKNFI